jgi:hypothetical protein
MNIRMEHTIEEGITVMAEDETRINIDAWDTYGEPFKVWLNIAVPRASCSAVLTKEQAMQIAAALTKFAEAA